MVKGRLKSSEWNPMVMVQAMVKMDVEESFETHRLVMKPGNPYGSCLFQYKRNMKLIPLLYLYRCYLDCYHFGPPEQYLRPL